jgi:nitrogen fixation protein FixH
MTRQFTGRHMAAILVAFFAVIIGVNFVMARYAASTFGGVVVENSYVASQHFNRWLDEAAKADAQGLRAFATRTADDHVSVILTGEDVNGDRLNAEARHPLGRVADRTLTFTSPAQGKFVSRETLPPGRWRVRIELDGGARPWRTEQEIQ